MDTFTNVMCFLHSVSLNSRIPSFTCHDLINNFSGRRRKEEKRREKKRKRIGEELTVKAIASSVYTVVTSTDGAPVIRL